MTMEPGGSQEAPFRFPTLRFFDRELEEDFLRDCGAALYVLRSDVDERVMPARPWATISRSRP